jgi:hypothetical protein
MLAMMTGTTAEDLTMKIKLVGEAKTTTTQWLQKYFRGEADCRAFVRHFSDNYRTSKGTRVPEKNVYSRLLRDHKNGRIRRK